MLLWAAVTALALGADAGESYRVVRDRHEWTRIDSGTIPVSSRGLIRIITSGAIHTQGEFRRDIQYEVRRRVRARTFAEASRRMPAGVLRRSVEGPWTQLRVISIRGEAPPEIILRVPKGLQQVWMQATEGAITALDLDGYVTADAHAGSVTLDRIGSAVRANTGGGEIKLGRIGGRVRCYSGGGGISVEHAGGDSTLETAGGEIFVREAMAPVIATTGGGNVEIINALSYVTAVTSGGLVVVNRAGGRVDARTSGGAIEVGTANGVACQSSAGAISLHSVTGQLRASTQLGSITAQIAAHQFADSFLNTSAGDITVLIPSTLAVTVQAESETSGRIGRILSDFPEIRVRDRGWVFGLPAQALGTLNGGGPNLRLSASGGIIYLKRQE